MTHRGHHGRDYLRLRAWLLATYTHCWICQHEVDMTLSGRHPWGPSLDMVQPISEGGDPLDKDNARLAHMRCNSSRGARRWARVTRRTRAHQGGSRHW